VIKASSLRDKHLIRLVYTSRDSRFQLEICTNHTELLCEIGEVKALSEQMRAISQEIIVFRSLLFREGTFSFYSLFYKTHRIVES